MARSYLSWWTESGVDLGFAQQPTDWRVAPPPQQNRTDRKAASPRTTATAETVTEIRKPASTATRSTPLDIASLPTNLVAFQQWLMNADMVPGGDWSDRVGPCGTEGADIMILSDMPDRDDLAAGQLLSARTGKLIDAMLAAIGLHRDNAYCASMSVSQHIGGTFPDDMRAPLAALAGHHISMVQPKALILLGSKTVEILGEPSLRTGAFLHDLNHIPSNLPVVAMHHPRLMLDRPMFKVGAWESLKLLRQKTKV